jgi:hypothetical protein
LISACRARNPPGADTLYALPLSTFLEFVNVVIGTHSPFGVKSFEGLGAQGESDWNWR